MGSTEHVRVGAHNQHIYPQPTRHNQLQYVGGIAWITVKTKPNPSYQFSQIMVKG